MDTHPFHHLSEDTLEAYSLHQLAPAQVAAAEEHLLICAECQAELAAADMYVAAMKAALLDPDPTPAASRRSRRPAFGWAVALAASLLIMMLIPWKKGQRPAPAPVTLSSFRGSERVSMAHAPARVPLDLGIESDYLDASQPWRIEIVDGRGRPAWHGKPVKANGHRMVVRTADDLRAGQYWVRLYGPAGLVQEFGLRLE